MAEDLGRSERYAVRAYAHDELRRELVKARTSEEALGPLVDRLAEWIAERWRVTLVAPALSGAERLRELLATYGLAARVTNDARPIWRWSSPGRVELRVAPLSEGFSLPLERLAVVTEEEIFGPRQRRRPRLSLMESAAIEGLAQLAPGDPLVHAEHGIGVYRGLVPLELGGASGEFLRLEYEGGDRLFVPVHRLNLIQRYVGADGHAPRIDRLGGSTWEKAKRSVRRSIRDMAQELLAVHAARELAEGHAYAPRDRHLEEFEATFPYEETPDQLAAIEDVLADLHRPRPMDRLVCGDVGYGKTEVAVRAAFRVVMEGKQVAVLVPTTILAQQHEETFRKRFEGHPVRIESLSRFRSAKEAKVVLEGLLLGTVDIVIGTHRLLQKSVRFRDLGLLVIDEEHRFGVSHKERLKQLKKTVDVLTLTATPIPRTLQLAFAGIRELSVIQTPPVDRLSIRTQLCRFSDQVIREAILREVRRGGQVFFVHNRVQTIDAMAEHLARVVPEVKVLVAHGQMKESELEKRMLAFMHGEADVLLCTTIVESGLDIPRANTILVNRADTFGLAQLYQLRGRVGRSSHRAYAYLLVPSEDGLTGDAERRLQAIQDLAELGSGFRLASMDLEIRGAGNLLGAEQSGNLAALGYDAYMQMLEETIDELRGQVRETEVDPEIRLPVAARLPEEFVPDVSQRLVLYKRLASSREDADVDRIRDEILDRFGHLPSGSREPVPGDPPQDPRPKARRGFRRDQQGRAGAEGRACDADRPAAPGQPDAAGRHRAARHAGPEDRDACAAGRRPGRALRRRAAAPAEPRGRHVMDARIRLPKDADVPALKDIYDHYIRETPITFDLEDCSLDERRRWLAGFAERGRYRLLVAEENGRVLGWACSRRFRDKAAYEPSVEASVYLAPDVDAPRPRQRALRSRCSRSWKAKTCTGPLPASRSRTTPRWRCTASSASSRSAS